MASASSSASSSPLLSLPSSSSSSREVTPRPVVSHPLAPSLAELNDTGDQPLDGVTHEILQTANKVGGSQTHAARLRPESRPNKRRSLENTPAMIKRGDTAESAKEEFSAMSPSPARVCARDSLCKGQKVIAMPTHGKWHSMSISARVLHSTCSDGKRIYLFGGVLNCPSSQLGAYHPRMVGSDVTNSSLLNVYAYTPRQSDGQGGWEELKSNSLSRPGFRKFHQMVYHDGKIYIFGGTNQENRVSSKVYVFNLDEESWGVCHVTGGTPPKCISHIAAIANDSLFVFGGHRNIDSQLASASEMPHSNSLDCYHLASGKWTAVSQSGDIPQPSIGSTLVSVEDKLYLYGGYSSDVRGKVVQKNLYEFNPATSSWKELSPSGTKPGPRCGHKCAVGLGGFYITGGESKIPLGGPIERDIHFYNIGRNEWIRVSHTNEQPNIMSDKFYTFEYLKGILYFMGGSKEGVTYDAKDIMAMSCFSLQSISELRRTSNTLQDLETIINQKEFSDLVLLVDEKELWCHRAVLCCRSAYFRSRIQKIEGAEFPYRLRIEQESFESVFNFVRFVYSGVIPLMNELEEVISLLELAIKFHEPVMASQCEELLVRCINAESAVNLLITSKKLGRQILKSASLQFITGHYTTISSTAEFRLLVKEPELLLEVCTSIGVHLDANEHKKRRKSLS